MQKWILLHGGLGIAREIIELWEKAMADHPESLFFLNEAQCTQMWRNFRRVYDAFEPSFSYRHNFKQKCLHVFIDFYNIVERGGKVMEMCSNREVFMEAAILYGDNERMFQELSDKLQFCVDCACKLTESLSFTSSHKPVNHVKVALLPYQANVDFKRDIAELKARLESLAELEDVPELGDLVNQLGIKKEMIHLAKYLLERQIFASTSDRKIQAQSSRQTVLALDMMLQMGLGMEYLHGQGVVHRDLKSPNVSTSGSPRLKTLGYAEVKLTDFGLAKVNVRDADIPTYKMTGTRGWRAPEAENPRKGDHIDWRLADTYSFAITCSEILTLQQPPIGRERPVLPKECPHCQKNVLIT